MHEPFQCRSHAELPDAVQPILNSLFLPARRPAAKEGMPRAVALEDMARKRLKLGRTPSSYLACMRRPSDKDRIFAFMRAFSEKLNAQTSVYFSGGVTAVLHDLRSATIDVDMIFEPDTNNGYQAIHDLKEDLNMNIEIAAPHHFIPELPQWHERSLFIEQHRAVAYYHYDLYSQIISKIQRGYEQDISDARGFLSLIPEPGVLVELLADIKQDFIRYPMAEFDDLKMKIETFLHEK